MFYFEYDIQRKKEYLLQLGNEMGKSGLKNI
jgi:hypothetical protein